MLTAIHLDDDPAIEADEVEVVTSEWRLTADVKAAFAESLRRAHRRTSGGFMAFRSCLARAVGMASIPHPDRFAICPSP